MLPGRNNSNAATLLAAVVVLTGVAGRLAELTRKLYSELEAQHKGVLTLVDTLLPLSNLWEAREAIICIEDRG